MMPARRSYAFDLTALGHLTLGLLRLTGALTRPFAYKGLYRVSRWLAPSISRQPTFRVTFADGPALELPVVAYWLRLVEAGYSYEPELMRVLSAIAHIDYRFIDCGANIGYWSTLVGHRALGAKRGLAVEAGSESYRLLCANLAGSGGSIVPLHLAIGDADDATVALSFRIGEACDAGASIADAPPASTARTGVEYVRTVTFDTLLRRHLSDQTHPLVVKLDIEGLEESVIRDSEEIERRDCLVIAEDHGSDPNNRVSAALLARGFSVAYLDERGGGFWFERADALSAVKSNPAKGYNILAMQPQSQFRAIADRLVGPAAGGVPTQGGAT